ncbi:putative PurR-regulated permease PerM [Kitasatospora sp. MAA4]|uniref:AI-2E family transporter n=1 Tax=Kitasatospora sp. MAA4 TaxID=3035093 RepID=UPI002476A6AB|nr:AI-2E family transporter [Kitasatospora sp. MAA4]MDH6137195.1 putative PurR-regulated permease PerM [Kitasatospora sp. MAA4]
MSEQLLPPAVRTAAAWSAAVILFIGVGAMVVFAFVELRAATIPMTVALLGTALLQPVMPWLVARGLGRGTAAALTCAVLVAVVCGVLGLLTNSLVHSAPQIAESLKQAGDQLADWLGPAGDRLQAGLSQAAGAGGPAGGSLLGSLAGGVLSGLMVEGNVLQPLIQSRTVELHPATIMFAVVAGAGIAGIIGALLAVPLCAAAMGIVAVLRGRPRQRTR